MGYNDVADNTGFIRLAVVAFKNQNLRNPAKFSDNSSL